MDISFFSVFSGLLNINMFWIAGGVMLVLMSPGILRRLLRKTGRKTGRKKPTRDSVSGVRTSKQPILNGEERRLYQHLKQWMTSEPWHLAGCELHIQVSLGEIVSADDSRFFYRHINAKRVDFVVVDKAGLALLVIEYQGTGHYGNRPIAAAGRDHVKKTVLKNAGIKYLAIHHHDEWPVTLRKINMIME